MGVSAGWRHGSAAPPAGPEAFRALEDSFMAQVRELKIQVEDVQAKASADAAMLGEKLLALGGGLDLRTELANVSENAKTFTAKCSEMEEKIAKLQEVKAEVEAKATEAAAASSSSSSPISDVNLLKALESKAEVAELKAIRAEAKVVKAAPCCPEHR